jgi:hypothetical protein
MPKASSTNYNSKGVFGFCVAPPCSTLLLLLALDRKLWEQLYILGGSRMIRSEIVKFEKSLDVEWSRPNRQKVMMSMQGIAEIPNAPSIIKETESSMAVKVEESAEPVRNTEANTTSAAQITPTQSTSPSSQSAIIKPNQQLLS